MITLQEDVGRIYGVPELHEMRLADFSEKDKRIWELVKCVPKCTSPWQYIVFLCNLFIPGLGTLMASLWASPCSKSQAIIGVLQFITAMFVIGWLWSVVWGCLIVSASNEDGDLISLLNQSAARSDDPNYGSKRAAPDSSKMYQGYNVNAQN